MHEQGTKYRFNGNRRHGLQIRASGNFGTGSGNTLW